MFLIASNHFYIIIVYIHNIVGTVLKQIKSAWLSDISPMKINELINFICLQGVKSFEELGGLDCLELLEYHANEELRGRTNDILDTYYYKDDDEVGNICGLAQDWYYQCSSNGDTVGLS